mgnify:CR=1 FL=1
MLQVIASKLVLLEPSFAFPLEIWRLRLPNSGSLKAAQAEPRGRGFALVGHFCAPRRRLSPEEGGHRLRRHVVYAAGRL